MSVLVFLPWFFYANQFPKPNCWCHPPLLGTFGAVGSYSLGLMGHFDIYDAVFGNKIPFKYKVIYYINLIFFISLYALSWLRHKFRFFYPMQLFLWLPFAILTMINIKLHIFSARSFIIFSPLYYVSIADFLTYDQSKKRSGLLVVACTLLLMIVGLNVIYAWDL